MPLKNRLYEYKGNCGQAKFWMEIHSFKLTCRLNATSKVPKGSNININSSETLVSYLGTEMERTYLDHSMQQ